MPLSTAKKFGLVYSSVEDIDLFTAGLAEKSISGGLVGPTLACIIGQQFSNLRRGDRFWYENPGQENSFTPGQLQQIRRISLAQVLCSTMDDIEIIQPFVFLTPDTLKNNRLPCNDPVIGQLNLEFWAERLSQFKSRAGFLNILKRKDPPQQTTLKPTTQQQVTHKQNTLAAEEPKIFPHRRKPSMPSINQHNRIVVKRPLGPPDNVTVVVQNNAVNSPIFVSDSIYGSNVRLALDPLAPSSQPTSQEINPPRPTSGPVTDRPPQQGLQSIPVFVPVKPIPTSPPPLSNALTGRPYIPYAFNDPNNPNPLSQGFQPDYGSNGVVFESFPATSPRPTLYTYYTNFQRPVTQRPHYDVDSYSSIHRPSPWQNLELQYPTTGQLSKPIYDAPGNQHSGNSYEAANWQKQELVNQLSDPGHWNSQRYRPNSPYGRDPVGWSMESDRYGPSATSLADMKPFPVFSYQTGSLDKNDRYQPVRPIYHLQPNRRPVQADPDGWSKIPTYQKEPDRIHVNVINQIPNYHVDRPSVSIFHKGSTIRPDSVHVQSPSERPVVDDGFTATNYRNRPSYAQSTPIDRPVQDAFRRNQSFEATSPPYQVQLDKFSSSYHSLAQPKPTQIYSVTVVTEEPETVSQSGYKVSGIGDRSSDQRDSEAAALSTDQQQTRDQAAWAVLLRK